LRSSPLNPHRPGSKSLWPVICPTLLKTTFSYKTKDLASDHFRFTVLHLSLYNQVGTSDASPSAMFPVDHIGLSPRPRQGYNMSQIALIVGDSRPPRITLQRLLEKQNFQVMSAGSAREAFDLLRAQALPDIIFMDHLMPAMDGFERSEERRVGKESRAGWWPSHS